MKKTILISVIMVIAYSISIAHPPSSVKLTYNKAEKKLVIEAVHKVKNVSNHFIDEITISVNGEDVDTVTLEKQSSLEAEKYSHSIALKSGDIVKVTAGCNKMGKRSAEITIQ